MRVLIVVACVAFASSPVLGEVPVTDADTLVVDGVKYRLDSIDAPESYQLCLGQDGMLWRCGEVAAATLARRIAAADVTCVDQGPDTKYADRRIGRCAIGDESIERWLVREGLAIEFKRHSNGRYAADEREAREARCGIWASCFVNPRDLRYSNRVGAELLGVCPTEPQARETARAQLFPNAIGLIKAKLFSAGKQFATGVRGIFHTEGCGSYGKMGNAATASMMVFASVEDAMRQGFRKARNCM